MKREKEKREDLFEERGNWMFPFHPTKFGGKEGKSQSQRNDG